MKWLKITVKSPYVGTDWHEYHQVPDDFDPDGKDAREADEMLDEAVAEYVDSWFEVVDEVPPEYR